MQPQWPVAKRGAHRISLVEMIHSFGGMTGFETVMGRFPLPWVQVGGDADHGLGAEMDRA